MIRQVGGRGGGRGGQKERNRERDSQRETERKQRERETRDSEKELSFDTHCCFFSPSFMGAAAWHITEWEGLYVIICTLSPVHTQ